MLASRQDPAMEADQQNAGKEEGKGGSTGAIWWAKTAGTQQGDWILIKHTDMYQYAKAAALQSYLMAEARNNQRYLLGIHCCFDAQSLVVGLQCNAQVLSVISVQAAAHKLQHFVLHESLLLGKGPHASLRWLQEFGVAFLVAHPQSAGSPWRILQAVEGSQSEMSIGCGEIIEDE